MVDKITEFLTNKIRKEMPEIDDERAEVINYVRGSGKNVIHCLAVAAFNACDKLGKLFFIHKNFSKMFRKNAVYKITRPDVSAGRVQESGLSEICLYIFRQVFFLYGGCKYKIYAYFICKCNCRTKERCKSFYRVVTHFYCGINENVCDIVI